MDLRELERLLRAFKVGELDEPEAARRISNLHFEDIGHARVDHARAERQGFPEVVFGAGKTRAQVVEIVEALARRAPNVLVTRTDEGDRKSTRLNSSHVEISYAVFCLKKKKEKKTQN